MDVATMYDMLVTVMTVITLIVLFLIFFHVVYGKEETIKPETK